MSENSAKDFNFIWKGPANKIGMATLIVMIVVSLIPNIVIYAQTGVIPEFTSMMSAWGMIATIYVAFYFIEPFSYYPILGLTGTYMAFMSGNIANLRMPASAAAQEAIGVEVGGKKAQVVSTLGIAGSVITNTIIITVAVILGTNLLNMFPEGVVMALSKFTLPAVFGGIFVQFAMNNLKVACIALPIPLILLGIVKVLPPWLVIAICVFLPIFLSRIVYKKGKL